MRTEREGSRQSFQGDVGKRLVDLRSRKGWTQGDLARRLRIPRTRLGKWEQGLRMLPLEILIPLSRVLEVPLEELLSGTTEAGGVTTRPGLSADERAALERHLEAAHRILKRKETKE